MDDTGQRGTHMRAHINMVIYVIAGVTMLLVTKVLFHKAEEMAHFCVALVACLSLAVHSVEGPRGPVLHFGIIAFITWFQFYAVSHERYRPEWLTTVTGVCLAVHLAFENAVIWVARTSRTINNETDMGEDGATDVKFNRKAPAGTVYSTVEGICRSTDFRVLYGTAANMHLLFWAMLPVPGVGILRARWVVVGGMFVVWATVVVTEYFKSRACRAVRDGDIHLSGAASKCAMLLYLPAGPWWSLLGGLVVWDVYFVARYHRGTTLWGFLRRGG